MLVNTANPLRQPKPSRSQCLYKGTFYFGNENAQLEGQFGQSIALGRDYLWLTDELSIPLIAIKSTEIIEKGWFPKRRGLKILYQNPIDGGLEIVVLLKFDFLGFYELKPLEKLKHHLELAGATAARPPTNIADSTYSAPAPCIEHPPGACEVCGATPAFYVSYTYQVRAIVLSYRAAIKRRIHCRRHNLLYGLGHYLLTAAVGWCGIGIFAYPFVVFATGRSLEPSLGKKASYALGIMQIVAVAGLSTWWAL